MCLSSKLLSVRRYCLLQLSSQFRRAYGKLLCEMVSGKQNQLGPGETRYFK